MTPSRTVRIEHLEPGEFFMTSDSALRVTAVTPAPHGGVRVDFENGAEVTFPAKSEVRIRAAVVL